MFLLARWRAMDGISLVVVIVAVGMLLLAAQRYFANKRLANKRRNSDERWGLRNSQNWQFPQADLG
jgi:hypothetical protein